MKTFIGNIMPVAKAIEKTTKKKNKLLRNKQLRASGCLFKALFKLI